MKKIIATLTAIATILVSAPLTAIISYGDIFEISTASAETYENLTYRISGGKISITDCNPDATEIVIPSEIDGIAVEEIANSAFRDCINLTSIVIPDSVIGINEYAFSGCTSLTSIELPISTCEDKTVFMGCWVLRTITSYSFDIADDLLEYCTGLETIYGYSGGKLEEYANENDITFIPLDKKYGNLSYIEYDDYVEIIGCDNDATALEIPSTIDGLPVKIKDFAFANKKNLISVKISEPITSIGEGTFAFCENLQTVELPSTLTSIEDELFTCCYALEEVKIPESVTSIGESTFSYCKSLQSIEIPDSVTEIGEYAFSNCISIEEIVIPDSITKINKDTFTLCSSLTSVTIPDSVTEIGEDAFSSCKNLVEITIPDSVVTIGSGALDSDTLKIVYGTGGSVVDSYISDNESNITFVEEDDYIGDMNLDNKIDAMDAILILQYYAKTIAKQPATINKTMADVNEDSRVDEKDAVLILRYYTEILAGIYNGSIEDFK